MIHRLAPAFAIAVGLIGGAGEAWAQGAPMSVSDLRRERTIGEPVFTPDGEAVIYSVTGAGDGDVQQSDLWRVGWTGGAAVALTDTPSVSEWAPEPSRDGRFIAFLSDGGPEQDTQLWVLPSQGGEARQVTHLPGGISAFSLSPDGTAAVVVAEVGARVGLPADATAPIVIDRYQFREDLRPWLDDRRNHLFRVDLASGAATALTDGEFDEASPAWSPDGTRIAFVSSRCENADRHICSDVYVMAATGGEATKVSTFEAGDADPSWEAGGPQWSPDSQRLVWVQGGAEQTTWYAPFQLAVADLDSGQITHPGWIDRWTYYARWSGDGKSILALIEQDRDTWLARVDPVSGHIDYLTQGTRFATGFATSEDGRIAVVDGGVQAPPVLRAVQGRTLADHNGWLAERRLAEVRDVSWQSEGVAIHGLLTLPLGYRPGDEPPLIVRVHGGPVYQYSHEFMADWQIYAAQGYAVLAPNPRGSSGRGQAFAEAQMGNWGGPDVADVSAGISHLIDAGLVDPDRIGIGGWSYGGILTNYMIVSDPRIRAAVSGAGMANFLGGYGVDMYARDYEIELGAPWAEPERWMRMSRAFFNAPRITAPTLYLCAEQDHNVPCAGSQQMYQALRSLGVPTRLVIYPGESHGLTTPSHIEDRMQRQLDWYDLYLAPTTTGD
ncbi:S9 family peptidase [Brevundimonas sp.]|uniref:S9 family peptidase n=1 Tax=Brevundimonas sp. TaxID=1871086 RepID=UPI003BAA0A22